MGVRPAPVGPASARPAAVNASGSRPIASTIPTSASSWAARAGMQGRPDPKDASWASPAAAGVASTRSPAGDAALRRTQAGGPEMTAAPLPGAQPPAPVPGPGGLMAEATATSLGGQSMSLQLALYGALTGNPDLVSLRQGNPIAPSAEAVEVARHWPTTLNPTVWIDYRPITLIPPNTFGTTGGGSPVSGGSSSHGGFYHYGQNYILVSIRQPIELGHQTKHRHHIAQAAFNQQQWTVLQAELTALVQTYRFFQTAAYRRERTASPSNWPSSTTGSSRRSRSSSRPARPGSPWPTSRWRGSRARGLALIKAARQDYLTALADLRNQVGMPDEAGAAEPLGEFTLPAYIPPVDEQTMVQTALANRPDIQALQAQVAGTASAVDLARGDRIPTP